MNKDKAQRADRATFRLHPALDASLYAMHGDCGRVRTWRAHCYTGEEDGDAGTMQDVGYVMVSLDDDAIIPIARGDEHHRGYDLLHDLAGGRYPGPGTAAQKALSISARRFVPVWSHGVNYIYGRDEIPEMLTALGKWLSYGGIDGILYGSNDLNGTAITSSEFVRRGGDVSVEPGMLAPVGRDLYERLSATSALLVAAGPAPDRPKLLECCRDVEQLLGHLLPFGYKIGYGHERRMEDLKRIRSIRRTGESQPLWELVFGFGGIKNEMHRYLREETPKNSAWTATGMREIWGDPGLAIDMLGRL